MKSSVAGVDMIVIAESVDSTQLPAWLATVPVPILRMEPAFLDELGMTGPKWDVDQGSAPDQTTLRFYATDGSFDDRAVSTRGSTFNWGVPATTEALTYGELATAPGHWAIFGYDRGGLLAEGARAPAKRIAYFAGLGTAEVFTPQGMQSLNQTLTDLTK